MAYQERVNALAVVKIIAYTLLHSVAESKL